MGKGAAKFGYKSGTLPVIRNILKKPLKPLVRPANPNAGYAEGVPHPRGTSREQPLPEVKSVEALIHDTVKEPKQIPDLKKLTEAQKEKFSKAALRREYYIESLKAEEAKLESQAIKKENRRIAEEKRKSEQVHEISEATKLTLPTINNLLEGPLMRQRTEEEKEILQAKRTANRLNNKLVGETNRAINLLELYYQAEKYVVDEAGLEKAIEVAFKDQRPNNFYKPNDETRSYTPILQDALFGKINAKPGLVEVEEQLTGERLKFEERSLNARNEVIREEMNIARRS